MAAAISVAVPLTSPVSVAVPARRRIGDRPGTLAAARLGRGRRRSYSCDDNGRNRCVRTVMRLAAQGCPRHRGASYAERDEPGGEHNRKAALARRCLSGRCGRVARRNRLGDHSVPCDGLSQAVTLDRQ